VRRAGTGRELESAKVISLTEKKIKGKNKRLEAICMALAPEGEGQSFQMGNRATILCRMTSFQSRAEGRRKRWGSFNRLKKEGSHGRRRRNQEETKKSRLDTRSEEEGGEKTIESNRRSTGKSLISRGTKCGGERRGAWT